jgi:hypothetical protein
MTNFLFWLGNHSDAGQRSLEDVIDIFGHQLRALGHNTAWDPKNDRFIARETGINVVVEGFTDAVNSIIANAHAAGARFICLATEEPTDKGFNHGRDREMVFRQQNFAHAGKYFEAIFHLVPGDHITKFYSQFAPSSYVELGYAPTLCRPSMQEPTFNFGFFGSLTPRRLKILKRLAKHMGTERAVRIEAKFPTQEDRDKAMRKARVIVQIRKWEEMGLVSNSRCNTALHLGRPVVAEPHLLSHEWNGVIRFSERCNTCAKEARKHSRNDFCEECVHYFLNDALLAQTMWRELHNHQFALFKTRMSPEYCVGRALKEVNLDLSPQKPFVPVAA